METIFDVLYLVSVYHRKRKTLTQHLVNGSRNDAHLMTKAVCEGYYRKKYKYLEGSIIEIKNDEVNLYSWYDDKTLMAKRDSGGDIYIVQEFSRAGGNHSIRFASADDLGGVADILSELSPGAAKGAGCAVNKISFRGVALLNGGTEARVSFGKYSHCKNCDKVHFPDGLSLVNI